MQKSVFFLIALFLWSISAVAQQKGEVAITINNKPIFLDELVEKYRESNNMLPDGEKQSVNSFIDSYIAYRLNLEEAYNQRLDTTKAFQREQESYRIQLSHLYLQDTITENKLVENILERFRNELEVNHIFIPFDSLLSLPKDTIDYYNQALKAREDALKLGFDNVKVENQANTFGVVFNYETHTGYLGWIRPFIFSQELEEILYRLELNKVTMPIRTEYGYHVFEVIGKRPLQGNPVVEQVLFGFSHIPATQQMKDSVYKVANSAYKDILGNNSFQLICDEFSRAFKTGDRGCLFGVLKPGAQAPLQLIEAASQLKNKGDISKPILTEYGYHILRLKDKTSIPTTVELEALVRESLNSKSVFPKLVDLKREQLMERNTLDINSDVWNQLLDLTSKYSPKEKSFDDQVIDEKAVLVSIDGGAKKYTVRDFLDYKASLAKIIDTENQDPLAMSQFEPMVKYSLSSDVLINYFNSFIYVILEKYEKDVLPYRSPEYAKGLKNISDGIVYATLLEKEIWGKAKTDVKGLEKTFARNKKKYTLPQEMFKGIVVLSKDEAILKDIENDYTKNKLSATALRKKYNESKLTIQVEEGLWAKGDNQYVDCVIYKDGDTPRSKTFPYFIVLGRMINEPQDFTDVRSQVEMDYQKELESNWDLSLRRKYKVNINQEVISQIK